MVSFVRYVGGVGMFRSVIILAAILLTVLFVPGSAEAQKTVLAELNGFRLGQYREAVRNELGEPDHIRELNNSVYEIYFFSREPMLYMVFQYPEDEATIYSVQISGAKSSNDIGFFGLAVGAPASAVEKSLGAPSEKADAGEHGTRWDYDNANYSVEINGGILSSIRVVDPRSLGSDPKLEAIPKFADVLKLLQKGTNAQLAEIMAPDMEVYKGEEVLYFKHVMRKEIAADRSGLFAAMRDLSKELSGVDPKKADQLDEAGRFSYGNDVMHVMKFPKLEKVKEIVFRWDGFKWRIWEFGAKKPPKPFANYQIGTLKSFTTARMPELLNDPNVRLFSKDDKPILDLSYNQFPTIAKVTFTGESREIPEARNFMLSSWFITFGKPKETQDLFKREYKFIENGVEYWLPVQSPVAEYFAKEVKKGDEIFIYAAWLGAVYEDGKPISYWMVNEFESIEK